MTSDHSTPRCLRCPDTALRLIDRGAFAVSRDAAPLPAAIRDSALTVEVWVCPICRRIELCYPEELPLPEPPEERLPSNPWPQWPRVKKTDYGHEEAIALFGHDPRLYQTTIKEFHKDENGNLSAVTIVSLESKKDEKTGRFMMVPVEGSEQTLPCELLLISAGFLGSQPYVSEAFGVELNQRTNVKTAEGSYKTNVDKVFTAGDMHRGQSLVVWGIAEGRACAREVDEYLMGYTCL